MRAITREAVAALLTKQAFSKSNTCIKVTQDNTTAVLYLHGNSIASINASGRIHIRDAGWQSVTTRERLNGLLEVLGKGKIRQKGGVWYREGEEFPCNTWVEVY